MRALHIVKSDSVNIIMFPVFPTPFIIFPAYWASGDFPVPSTNYYDSPFNWHLRSFDAKNSFSMSLFQMSLLLVEM